MKVSKLVAQGHAKCVIKGTRTLHDENVTDGVLAVPKAYREAVSAWITEWCKKQGYEDGVAEAILAR